MVRIGIFEADVALKVKKNLIKEQSRIKLHNDEIGQKNKLVNFQWKN